ncbi:MAG TPA: hypothetical protein DCS21_08235 [Gammaproteobacteria bacterium]|nr:hypothetical protein [Gammaproteobacteria bacterium]
MLQTLEATLLPSGIVAFSESLAVDHPIPVLITLLERVPEPPAPASPATEIGAMTPEQSAGLPQKISELGRKLLAIRQRAIAEGMKFDSVDDILEEVRQGRAEAGDDQNLR